MYNIGKLEAILVEYRELANYHRAICQSGELARLVDGLTSSEVPTHVTAQIRHMQVSHAYIQSTVEKNRKTTEKPVLSHIFVNLNLMQYIDIYYQLYPL